MGRTRVMKSFELSPLQRAAAPAVAIVAGVGGYALEVCFGRPVAEGVVSGLMSAGIFGTAAYYLPRLEEVPDPAPPISRNSVL